MTMTYKTVAGKITQPGTNVGIRVKVIATPLTTAGILTFTDDDRITVGPQTALTDSSGNLGTLKIPTNVDIAELYWHISAEVIDKVPGVPKLWTLKNAVEITGTGTVQLNALVEVDTITINPGILVNLSDLVVDAENARDDAEAAELAAEGHQAAAAASATAAAGSATAAAGSAATASGDAATASTKASESAGSAAASAGSAATATGAATTATTKAGEASSSATAAATAKTAAETARDAAQGYATTATTKAGEASGSATTASGAATTATTKAGEASTSASSAATAKTAAETARDAAGGYASTADGSAGAAAASAASILGAVDEAEAAATTATTKAGEAAASATAADGSADAAAQSAIDAANSAAEAAAGGVTSVNAKTGAVTLTQDDIGDGTTNKAYAATEKTKLAGIATGATANATDAQLRDRSTHTGTQAASTVAGLAAIATSGSAGDLTGTIPTSVLPPLAINETFTAASQAAMLALTAQRGDMAIRSDSGRTYVLSTDSPSTLADWKEVMAAGQVQSVAGKTGVVSLVASDVGAATTAQGAKADTAVQQGSLATVATTGAYADLTAKPTLGDAAAKNTGTAAGTVAAGDDSRITGAVQNDGGAAKLKVLTQAAYNAIGTKDSATVYVVVG